jgi:beta-glucosidase/6-phospho-beta-glucosidase/beta-galactosidase
MRQLLGKRLPKFTTQQLKIVKDSADFIGLNHYSSMMAAAPKNPPNYSGYWADQYVTFSDDPSWSKTNMSWNIVPDGAREMLLWLDKRYNHPLIFVTENGMAADEPDLEHSLQDTSRKDYLEAYLRGFGRALNKGVNFGGYFAWSLMDNFEWEYGFSKRFGLVHVNYTTLVRTPKMSADWYQMTIASNGANIMID